MVVLLFECGTFSNTKMILVFLIVILVMLLINWIRLIYNARRLSIPGPTPLPFLGNSHLFMSADTGFLGVLNKFSRRYGDVFRVFFFSNPIVVVSHPKYLEQLLSSTELITKGRTYRFLEPWLGNGLLTSTGNQWRTHRKFLTPAFHFNILQVFLPTFYKNVNILTKKLQAIRKGTEINLFPIVALSALDSVTESIMGVSVNAQEHTESDYVKAINEIANVISQRMQIAHLAEDAIFNLLPIKRRHDKALQVLHSQTNSVIQARREELKKMDKSSLSNDDDVGMKNRYAFLDLLLLANISDNLVSDEVNTFMFEGQDTTTTSIVWAIFILSKHRDVQEKLYEELQNIFTDDMNRDPTYHELQQMKYMDLVLKECMRLYSPVPIIERLIEKDCELGGLKLIKGTTLTLNIFEIHRHPDLYEDPLEFRPERFEKPLKHPYDFLAFSAGPRNCIGQKFALMAIKVTLTSIIKNFVIMPTEHEPQFSAELVLKSKNGIFVKLYGRN